MKPSRTDRGQSWIAQFDLEDRPVAAKLLDSIRFAPTGDVVAGVRRTIETLVSSRPPEETTALVPILSREDFEFLGEPLDTASPVVFTDYSPSQSISGNPGSEALFALLNREISTAGGDRYLAYPITRERMIERKVRNLVMVTDFIGSGRQVVEHAKTWLRNRTIRSWISGGFLSLFRVGLSD